MEDNRYKTYIILSDNFPELFPKLKPLHKIYDLSKQEKAYPPVQSFRESKTFEASEIPNINLLMEIKDISTSGGIDIRITYIPAHTERDYVWDGIDERRVDIQVEETLTLTWDKINPKYRVEKEKYENQIQERERQKYHNNNFGPLNKMIKDENRELIDFAKTNHKEYWAAASMVIHGNSSSLKDLIKKKLQEKIDRL